MTKYEYLVGGLSIGHTPGEQGAKLNELGDQGWELIAVLQADAFTWFYLRRCKEMPPRWKT